MQRSLLTVVIALTVVVASGGLATAAAGGSAVQDSTQVDCSFPISSTDATGETVTIEEEPEDVVALGPSAAQVMWAIDAEEKVTGMPVSPYTNYLNGSEGRTNVFNSEFQPITEEVVNLQPDLVLAPNIVSNETVNNLRDKGLTVYRFEQADSIDDVTAKTRLSGRLVGNYEQASQVSARTEATVEAIAETTSDGEDPSVYYAMGGGYTAGDQTFIGNVIDAAGGDNIASGADIQRYGVISEEIVVDQNPDWIVMPGQRSLRKSPAINATTAVEEDQILRVNANFMSQPGPRVTQPLTTMAGTFHPDTAGTLEVDTNSVSVPSCDGAAAETTTTAEMGTPSTAEMGTAPEETMTTAPDSDEQPLTVTITAGENAMKNATGPDTTTDESDSSGGFGPGFGPIVALVTLVATGLLARRR